jgi:hypothetical protein
MLQINFSNAEDLIFYDTNLQSRLKIEMFSIFEQWRMSKRIPYLSSLGKQAILDFLNTITDEDLAILEEYFGDKIELEKLNYTVVQNFIIPISESEICEYLCRIQGMNYFSTWRDSENLHITFWR